MRSTSCSRRHQSTRRPDTRRPYFLELNDLLALFDALPEPLSRQAFSHSSWVSAREESYERLAFLGDSVLNIAVSRKLFPRFPHSTAGRLTKIRAQTVSRRACVEVARAVGVPERMRDAAPPGYEHQVQRLVSAESVLAEAVEAGIGACLLEHGFERTADAVADAFEPQIERAIGSVYDFKSELQERLAQRGKVVVYRVVNEEGPPHDRMFETVAEVGGDTLGTGSGRSKKESEQEAARTALATLDDREAAPLIGERRRREADDFRGGEAADTSIGERRRREADDFRGGEAADMQ